jgi:hypothetical protein
MVQITVDVVAADILDVAGLAHELAEAAESKGDPIGGAALG